jgi:hypothetical protein
MITLTLADEELEVLTGVLDSSIEDLRQEIHDSDRSQYKEMLRHRREVLVRIHQQLVRNPFQENISHRFIMD